MLVFEFCMLVVMCVRLNAIPFKVMDMLVVLVMFMFVFMLQRFMQMFMRVSEFLCKRFGLQLTEMRSPNSMVNRVRAAFQSLMGMLHFWLMLRSAR